MIANLVNGADVGMVQGGGGTRLAAETFQGLRVLRDVVGQELERDEAAQVSVLGLVHHAHPAAAEFADDTVVRDRRIDHALKTKDR
jgi:hypothetical protein